jgi:hypothetical protein
MALNAAYFSNPTFPRLLGDDDTGTGGDNDGGGDGGGSDLNRSGAFTLFPAVYNDGGTVKPVGYLQNTLATFLADYAAAGFTPEGGFLVNVNGVAVAGVTFMTATGAYTAPPFGTPETLTTLTKDGITNITRTLIRFGP